MMTVIDRQEVVATAFMIQRLQKEASKRARQAVKKWIAAHPGWEAADLRRFCTQLVQQLVAEYGNAASSLSCDLYDGIMGGEFAPAEPWDGSCDAQLERAVRYQLSKALNGDEAAFLDAIDEMVGYYVRRHANETTMANCERDNRLYSPQGMGDGLGQAHNLFGMPRGGRPEAYASNMRRRRRGGALEIGDPAFARVPTGAETCTYCLMLASRGFAYHSADSAGHADHRGCNCMIVPGRHGDTVEGVDTSALYDCWRKLEEVEAWQRLHPDKMDNAELETRKRDIVDGYGSSVMLSTDPGEVRKLIATTKSFDGFKAAGWYTPRMKAALNYDPDKR